MFFQARFCSPCAAGFAGLFVIAFFQTEKLPPLVAVFALAGVCIGNAENILFALQVSKKFWGFSASAGFVGFLFGDFENMLPHLFHVNLLLLSVFHIALVIDIVLILFGQGTDGHAKAFTMTADWIFSTQVPPPPLEYRGHYLCTVAAGGHRSIVKPLRFGIRRGHRIIINRQLAVANAFEINTNGKLSRELAGAVTQADFAKEQNHIRR